MDAILRVDNLTKQYADFKLDHVSFSVPKGTIMGLIGENGAGKSTTINAILDLIRKDDGTVTFWGQELSSSKQLKEDIGVVFDGINFYETLTPAKVGKIAGAAYKQWDAHLFQDYLKRFQLPTDKEIKSLSKGMKMKLCIAVALSHKPKLLILDEATSGLDPVMRDDILDVFLDFVQDENHSILMSSHITTDLEKVADYITFIHQGKVLFCKTKDELRYRYGIVRCGAVLFDQLDKEEVLTYRKDVGEINGWVYGAYVTTETSYSYGETKEQEEARIAAEEEQKIQEAAAAALVSKGQSVVDYAYQFLGNPYVWGGTSLTNGADCSGFVQSVYAHFGISLPRTSYEQRTAGDEISYAEAQPGDLILYEGHVGIYMGDGKIINAMNEAQGIGVCSATYTNIVAVRRVL